MIPNTILIISAFSAVTFGQITPAVSLTRILATHEISLEERYPVKSVSNIFRDNILLNLAYLRGDVISDKNVNWDKIRQPFEYEFRLEPNQTFAFHDDVLDKYKDMLVKTTNAHFSFQEGFKSDGYLFGDGVCHLASLINWVAQDAFLDSYAPTNHDFMKIPEINRQFGVSIYSNPIAKGSSQMQNLYVTNNKDKAISFKFEYNGEKLKASVFEEN